jgi:hypothetical protein
MSDNDIREAWLAAEEAFQKQTQNKKDYITKNTTLRSERSQKCSDLVYRERNPEDCHAPISWLTLEEEAAWIYGRTLQEFYEAEILGICRYISADNYKELLEHDCLPPRS